MCSIAPTIEHISEEEEGAERERESSNDIFRKSSLISDLSTKGQVR